MANEDTGMGPAPAETVGLWCDAVAKMDLEILDAFERRTFATWDPDSLGDLRIAIQRRRRDLAQ